MNVQLRRRLDINPRRAILIRILGGMAALVLTGLILWVGGRNPFSLADKSLRSTFTTQIGFEDTLLIATPILMAAVAVAIGFRAKVWNIGVAGQFYMGAWGAALVGLHYDGPAVISIPLMAIAAAICGALWALGPAVAKAYLDINEVVTTLLLNFVAVQWVVWWSTDMWRDPNLGTLSATPRMSTELPLFPGAITLHTGFIVPVALVILFSFIFRNSIWGYEVDLTGGNRSAAEFAGIPVARRIITVLVVSGAVAGLSGMIQMTGSVNRLSGTLENQYGISGFMVAALAGLSFLALLAVGFFVSFLLHSGIVLSTGAGGITVNLVLAIYGFILLSVGVAEVATRYRLVIQRSEGRSPPPRPSPAQEPRPEEVST
jgi:simple sugar transport system permease protein